MSNKQISSDKDNGKIIGVELHGPEPDLSLHRNYAIVILLLCLGLTPSFGLSQTTSADETSVTAEILQARIQEVGDSSSLGEADRAGLLDLYQKSLGLINQRQSYENRTREFATLRESAPKQAARLRAEIRQIEASPVSELQADLENKSLAQLEQLLLGEKTRLSGLTASLTEAGALLEAQSARTLQIRERLDQARRRQAEIADEIKAPAASTNSQRQEEARLWALQLETRALAAEIEMLNQELLSQPMRVELYTTQRNKASLQWDRQQRYVDLLGALVGQRRLSEAESARQEAEEIERSSFGKHPLLQQLAQENSELSNQLNQLAAQVHEVNVDASIVTDQSKRFATSYRLARQKLEIAGLSQALGEALLQERHNLPRAKDFRSAEKKRQQLVVESSLRQIRNQQERARLSDQDEYIATLSSNLSESWQGWLSDELGQLVQQRRDLLEKAIAADESLLQALSELDYAQRELSKVVSDYNRLLDERLLWVRTGDPPSWESLASIGQKLTLFASAAGWLDVVMAVFVPPFFPWLLLLGLSLFAYLLWRSPSLHFALRRCARNVGQLRHDRFYYSLKALVLTLVLALPWPILFATLGLHLQLSQGTGGIELETHLYQLAEYNGQWVPSIGAAFYDIAFYSFYFIAFRLFCIRQGLAEAHFNWSQSSTELLRREILHLMIVFLPSVFLLAATITYEPAALASGFSRLLICIILAALAWCFGRIFSPANGAMREFYRDNPANPLTWFRYLWFALGLLLPVLLGALATAGYVYTATQLGARLVDTLWLIVAVVLIHQLVVRWVELIERQLQFRNALERRRAQRAARDAQENDAVPVEASEEPEIDFVALSENTLKLINSAIIVVAALGMWATWSEVLPAFRILDEVSLWSYESSVDGVVQEIPVTLGNLTSGLLIIVLGAIVALRLPALMEILLFARFDITAGSRYAISKLMQYTIIAVALIMMFSVLGGSWGEIQWLIAALGVGIGFGLQEIIANFISGLILLFERPIRIGDIVTVGDTSGVVTKIRIRSTTIRNWDQQELLVPNKEFITGRLLNWTLSDPVARIVVNVGVAYGSDVGKALKILLSVAEQHERIIDEPPPLVTFENFGDNSLNLVLRCYIASMDYRLQTMSELNEIINREFEAAGIVIAFPQRDIHLDTSRPLDVHIHHPSADLPQS